MLNHVREREIHHQCFISCARCSRTFPVNIHVEDERLLLDTGPIIYDKELGFICQSCSVDPLGDNDAEQGRTSEDIAEDILDLLYAERQGLTIAQLSDMMDMLHVNAAFHVQKLFKDGSIRREKGPGKSDLYFYVDAAEKRGK